MTTMILERDVTVMRGVEGVEEGGEGGVLRVREGWHAWYRVPVEAVALEVARPVEAVVRGRWAFAGVAAWRVAEDVKGELAEGWRVQRRVLVQAMTDRARIVRGVHVVDEEGDAGLTTAGAWVNELATAGGSNASCFATLAEAGRVLREPGLWLAASDDPGALVATRVVGGVVGAAGAWRERAVDRRELPEAWWAGGAGEALEHAARIGPVTLRRGVAEVVGVMPGRLQAGELLEGVARPRGVMRGVAR